MRYLTIALLLILVSCNNKMDVNNSTEVKEEWNPGTKYSIITECNTYNPGIYIPYRELKLENTTYDELMDRYGEPFFFSVDTLVNGRSTEPLHYDDGQPDEETCAILYDYIHPVIADSLFKDKKCIIYNATRRTHENADPEKDMAIRIFFASDGKTMKSIWGYKETYFGMLLE